MTRGGFNTPRRELRTRKKKEIHTINRVDKPLREDPVGDLASRQEQSETDSNSLIFVPNRIRSDSKNDYRSRQRDQNGA